MPEIAIAIDGPGSAGKGTIARAVAHRLGYQYVDTGAMYRAVALFARRIGIPWTDGARLQRLADLLEFHFAWDGEALRVRVNEEDVTRAIRDDEISTGASVVSTHPAVRDAMVAIQQGLGRKGGIVMDGRDIGTVVLPDAALKVYLDASLEERARRRHDELLRRGEIAHYDQVLANLAARDRQDSEREFSPLRQAKDAVAVDSTNLTPREAIELVVALARARGAGQEP